MISLTSLLPATAFLTAALAVAVVLTYARPFPLGSSVAVAAVRPLYLIATAAQAVHFLEEYLSGFPVRFPTFLGLAPWSDGFFVVFNVLWIVIWLLAAVGLERGVRLAAAPVWFLAIASMGNGIAHPLLAVAVGGYFPGLITAPLVGVLGLLLWRRLSSVTGASAGSPGL